MSSVIRVDSLFPTVTITNVSVNALSLQNVGGLYWVQEGNKITVSGDVDLPDGEVMAIIQQVVNGSTVVDELRRPAVILNGKLTLEFTPRSSRVHVISAERLNVGLAAIGAPFRVELSTLEFDVYAPA